MNIQHSINKLLLALKYKGEPIKYETITTYEEKNLTMYVVYKKINEKWIELWRGFKKINLLLFLVEYYKRGDN